MSDTKYIVAYRHPDFWDGSVADEGTFNDKDEAIFWFSSQDFSEKMYLVEVRTINVADDIDPETEASEFAHSMNLPDGFDEHLYEVILKHFKAMKQDVFEHNIVVYDAVRVIMTTEEKKQ